MWLMLTRHKGHFETWSKIHTLWRWAIINGEKCEVTLACPIIPWYVRQETSSNNESDSLLPEALQTECLARSFFLECMHS